jgi:hypothetical protein
MFMKLFTFWAMGASIWNQNSYRAPKTIAGIYEEVEQRFHKNNKTQEIPVKQKSAGQEQQKPKEQKPINLQAASGAFTQGKTSFLSVHRRFSDDWWKALLGQCTACDKSYKSNPQSNMNQASEDDREIDCKVLLSENPAWNEVSRMSDHTKQAITKRVLTDLTEVHPHDQAEREKQLCNFTCAICVGGDPNTRAENQHLALHEMMNRWDMKQAFPTFRLLLQKGANPNLNCTGAYPLWLVGVVDDSVRSKWERELRKFGATKE